ncbi:lysylphosphatidylglycerol synthase transmembrane domain-containing protein [Marinobacterium litorale]|uniref:lysylphosphatidylglycerol synthase transmembrane domain-containing protein n=1 Tax=Marinobacterium litorale TaxID=404770 RepID=UPI00316AC6C4
MLLFTALFIALSAAVPYVMVSELDLERPALDGRLFDPLFLLALALLLLLYFTCDGLRLYFTLRALGYRIPLLAQTRLVFINLLVSNVTPMATGGGVAQIWYLRHQGVHLGAATAATTLRTLQAVFFIFLPTPLLLLLLPPLRESPLGDQLAAYLALFAAAYLLFFAVLLWRMRWLLATADQVILLLSRFHLINQQRRGRWHFFIRRELLRFRYACRAFFQGQCGYALLAILFTAGFLLALFSFPAVVLWGLDYDVDYGLTLGLLVVTTFIMYFAPTPGASGVAEGVFGLFFSALVQSGDLVLTILVWRFLTIHLGMLIGVPVTLHTVFRPRPND